jgi:glutamate/tyrosine decarboxylase-like PLP-dependent enzyme
MNPQDKRVLEQALAHAIDHLERVDQRPVAARGDLKTLRERLGKPLLESGIPAEQVIEELVRDARDGIHGSASGRFFGWVVGGAVSASLAADWLTAAWDQNAGLFSTSPAAAVVEEVAGEWLKELLGLPAQASFAFVTGGQMANTTCLAAARYRVLQQAGWDVEARGLFGAPPIRVLTGAHRHSTISRSIRLLGLGTDSIVDLAVGKDGGVDVEALAKELDKERGAPTIVLLHAGEINTGAFDDFSRAIPLAKKHGAWVHIDGAFGLWAAASPKRKHLLNGAEAADSWATDGHKWLNVPYDCGYSFVADAEVHRAAMSMGAAYLISHGEARDQVDWNPELSRRARGFPTYAAIRQLGRHGIAEMVERCCEMAHALATRIGALPGAELMWEPIINQGLVRFLDPRSGATEADHDVRTERVVRAVVQSGEALFGPTTWNGKRCMRISVSSFRTSAEDVDRVVNAVARVLSTL